jgi:hypothetical protein
LATCNTLHLHPPYTQARGQSSNRSVPSAASQSEGRAARRREGTNQFQRAGFLFLDVVNPSSLPSYIVKSVRKISFPPSLRELHLALWTVEVEDKRPMRAGLRRFRCKLAASDFTYYSVLLRALPDVKLPRVTINLPYGYADQETVKVSLEALQVAVRSILHLLRGFKVSVNCLTEEDVDKTWWEACIAHEVRELDGRVKAGIGLASDHQFKMERRRVWGVYIGDRSRFPVWALRLFPVHGRSKRRLPYLAMLPSAVQGPCSN